MPRYTVLKQYSDAAGLHLAGEITSMETAQAVNLCRAGYATPYNETPADTIDERMAELENKMDHVEIHLSTTISP